MSIVPKASVLLLLALTSLSCSQDRSVPERIRVTAPDGEVLSNTVYIPLEGATSSWIVSSQEPLTIFFKEATNASPEWFSIKDVRQAADGSYSIEYTAEPRGHTLELRSGTLSMVAPEHYLGAFISVRQGYEKVWSKTFQGDGLSLLPGSTWTSETMDGISGVKDAWLSFTARADEQTTVPSITVSLVGGAYFYDINRTAQVIDVQSSESFGADSFYKLHIYNGGKVFSSESKVVFSVPAESAAVIHIGAVSVYEIPVKSSGITGISQSDE